MPGSAARASGASTAAARRGARRGGARRRGRPCAVAFAIATRELEPCAITARPRRPSRYPPPYVSGSSRRAEPARGGADQEPAEPRRGGREDLARAARSSTLRIVPSSVFSATLPVKPSQTTTSASPSSSVAALGVALEAKVGALEQRVRLERQLVALLGLLADREEPDGGLATSRISSREDDAHVGELEEVLRARVCVRAGVDQHGRPAPRGDHDRDPRPVRRPGSRRTWSSDAASTAPVFPAETTAAASPSPTARTARDERRVGLGAHRLGGLLVHRDRLGARDELEPLRVEPRRPEEDRRRSSPKPPRPRRRRPPRGRGLRRARRPRRERSSVRYGAGARSGATSRPRYVLHVGQTWCARFGEPQFSHVATRGAEMPCWARRLSRRDLEVFRFGTAMSGRE